MADRGRTRQRQLWGDEPSRNRIAVLLDIPTALTGPLTAEQLDAYALNFRIKEITEKLRLNDVVPVERSPSPPPQYDQDGKRINTREIRYQAKLEQERHNLVEKAIRLIPKFKPPGDYKPAKRTQEKIYIPANDFPEVNFIGLLIGPRGKTLQKMEMESGARIAIRGKGSVKEGKGRSNENLPHVQSLSEDLHCLIVADTEEKINKAVELVNKIIETAASTPESQNDLKRGQLRELAAMNGTLRDWENQPCQNCGELGHRKYECPNKKNYTTSIVCRICGGQGHFARDCKERRGGGGGYRNAADREYEQLMLELGGNGASSRFGSGANSTPLSIEPGSARSASSHQGSWQQQSSPSPWQGQQPSASSPWPNPPQNAPWKSDGPSDIPGFPMRGIPTMPGVPIMPGMPTVPGLPTIPHISGPPGFSMGLPPGSAPPPPPVGQFVPPPPPPGAPVSGLGAPAPPSGLPPPPPGAPPGAHPSY